MVGVEEVSRLGFWRSPHLLDNACAKLLITIRNQQQASGVLAKQTHAHVDGAP